MPRFEQLLKPIFPVGATFRRRGWSDELQFDVAWKLKNDPLRPNKRSRRVILVISEETLEDYSLESTADRGARERRMANFVEERLKTFNPNHNTPYGQSEPEEEWHLL